MILRDFQRQFDAASLDDYFELLLTGEDCLLDAVGEERYKSLHASAAVIGLEQVRQKRAEHAGLTTDASAAKLAAENALSLLKRPIIHSCRICQQPIFKSAQKDAQCRQTVAGPRACALGCPSCVNGDNLHRRQM